MNKILTLLLFFGYGAFAKEIPKYPVSAIAPALLNDANAVYRVDEMVFRIHSKSKATLFVRKAITILNKITPISPIST